MSKCIVSLTSYPAAIPYAAGPVKSILNGNVLPDKIVLYLTASQFSNGGGEGKIPSELLSLAENEPLFEIRHYESETDIRSYTKLIPALKDFPNDLIVTIDDDVLYHKNMLRDLLRLHKKYPNAIIGHRVRRIKPGVPYCEWPRYLRLGYIFKDLKPRFDNLQTGVGGVLYPPNSLYAQMLDPALFTKIAPTTDDIWFWGAAVANGTKIAVVPFGHRKPKNTDKPREMSLMKLNISSGKDVNRIVFESILERYPIVKQRVMSGSS